MRSFSSPFSIFAFIVFCAASSLIFLSCSSFSGFDSLSANVAARFCNISTYLALNCLRMISLAGSLMLVLSLALIDSIFQVNNSNLQKSPYHLGLSYGLCMFLPLPHGLAQLFLLITEITSPFNFDIEIIDQNGFLLSDIYFSLKN